MRLTLWPNSVHGVWSRRVKRERNLYSFEERRLAKLLRQASMAYIRQEYGRAQRILADAAELVEWANRPEWNYGQIFLEQWSSSVKDEQNGRASATAPAAWIHLAQELAALIETGGDWDEYLRARWRVVDANLSRGRRIAYGAMGAAALGLGALVLGTSAYGFLAGELGPLSGPSGLLLIGRLLGSALMVEHGFYWGRRALRGKSNEQEAVFMPAGGGLRILS